MKTINLLIIDDNQDLADGFAVILADQGFEVSIAYNGNDGLCAFADNPADLVLLDINLPDINGVEVYRRLHKIDPAIRVLIMTGYCVEQILEQVIDSGNVEVFQRPFAIDQVFDAFSRKHDENLILIADDDPFFAGTLSSYFSEYGLKPLLASNYQQALDGVVDKPVEILVLDLHIPIICALEVYLNLKQQNKIIKTVIVTGNINNGEHTDDPLHSASVTGCLFKPFTPTHLLTAINKALDNPQTPSDENPIDL